MSNKKQCKNHCGWKPKGSDVHIKFVVAPNSAELNGL